MKIKGAVLRECNQPVTIEELELEPPKEKEVLVKYRYTGFCRSDLHHFLGELGASVPMVVGHEAAGVVEEVGPGVTTVKKGDHVVGTWMIPCGECFQCRRGRGNLCRGYHEQFLGGLMLDGTSRIKDKEGKTVKHGSYVAGFATYGILPETGTIPIRKDMPLEQACFMGCCVPTGWGTVANIAKLQPGESVAIFGIGGVGLNVLRAAVLRQANPVIAVDIEGDRETIAREFGATHFIDSSKEDPVPKIQEIVEGGADVVFEAIGDPGATVQAYWSTGVAGKLVIPGVTPVETATSLPLFRIPLHQLSILGGLYGAISTHLDIPKLADLAMTQDFLLDKLVTKKFKLEDINDVADAMIKRQITGRWVCELGD